MVDLGTAKSVYMVSIDDEHLAKLLEACPFYAKYTIGKDVYKTPEDCQTVTVKATLVADASVSDDVAYAIVKTIFENKDEITTRTRTRSPRPTPRALSWTSPSPPTAWPSPSIPAPPSTSPRRASPWTRANNGPGHSVK